MSTQMEKLLHYFRNAENPQVLADKVVAAIEYMGTKWVGHRESTFQFKRAEGMFRDREAVK